jgi:hypothetical protein
VEVGAPLDLGADVQEVLWKAAQRYRAIKRPAQRRGVVERRYAAH